MNQKGNMNMVTHSTSTEQTRSVKIRNFRTITKGEETVATPLPMTTIVGTIKETTGGWPRRVENVLFTYDGGSQVDWLHNANAMCGWLGTEAGSPPEFRQGAKFHSASHIFEELRRTAQCYTAIESLPHEPPIPEHFYACQFPEPPFTSTGKLDELVGRYNPETDIDADLIKAAFVTVVWGGPLGSRPCFVIESDAGRGAGKTTLANHISYFGGGSVELSATEDYNILKTRLLSPEGMRKRVALLDNVKSMKFSSAELEALITIPTISGKRNYFGEGSRPNNLVWIITLNGVNLSKDLAQRAVIIKLGKPKRSATWAEDTLHFIEANREELIRDCIAFLRTERCPLDRYSRWASWEREVLERLPEPSDAQQTILERQQTADVEDDEAGIVQEFFAGELRRLGYDSDRDRVFLPSKIVAEWFNTATNERHTTTKVTRMLNQQIGEGTYHLLARNSCNSYGRGFLWFPPIHESDTTYTDIESRISRNPNNF